MIFIAITAMARGGASAAFIGLFLCLLLFEEILKDKFTGKCNQVERMFAYFGNGKVHHASTLARPVEGI